MHIVHSSRKLKIAIKASSWSDVIKKMDSDAYDNCLKANSEAIKEIQQYYPGWVPQKYSTK